MQTGCVNALFTASLMLLNPIKRAPNMNYASKVFFLRWNSKPTKIVGYKCYFHPNVQARPIANAVFKIKDLL